MANFGWTWPSLMREEHVWVLLRDLVAAMVSKNGEKWLITVACVKETQTSQERTSQEDDKRFFFFTFNRLQRCSSELQDRPGC